MMNTPVIDPVFGCMIIPERPHLSSALPLESTSVDAWLVGPTALTTVTQRFSNLFDQPIELEYLFPLPHNAAVVDFEFQIGGRVIRGEIEETEQARQKYRDAIRAGQRAGLLEQKRPNLFSVRLGNVLPGEAIRAVLRYQAALGYSDGEYEYVFPMGLTPRYHSPVGGPGESDGLDAPITERREEVGPVEISLSVDAGTPVGEPRSPSHPIETVRLAEGSLHIRLSGRQIPDHDFVLRLPVSREMASLAAWRTIGEAGQYFLATVLPPAIEFAGQPPEREFIFVLDRSGSMTGEPIAQAVNALRACLRALNPGDRFGILLFDDLLDWYAPEPQPVTQDAIDRADAFLAGVDGRGGTEIIPALQAALGLPPDLARRRYVVFLTDGAVSAEERMLEHVRQQLGDSRIFTFGIGPSVNRYLLGELARLGGGTAEFLGLDEDIEGAILRFQDRVAYPALTDLKLTAEGGQARDIYPARLPDLYAGQPLIITGRFSGKGRAALTLHGQRAGEAVSLRVELPLAAEANALLARVWARMRVDDLLDRSASRAMPVHKARDEIIDLAIEHRLVTPYTALVAIDPQVVNAGGQRQTVQVAQPLPQGLDLGGFAGRPRSRMFAVASAPMAAGGLPWPPMPSDSSELAAPTFMTGGAPAPLQPGGPQTIPIGEDLLRYLARTQKLNGSWGGDLERSAAALLAFVRHSHTTRRGSFRVQVKRAAAWLEAASTAQALQGGFGVYLTAVALKELAQAEGRNLSGVRLPAAPGPAPAEIRTLDDLRAAAALGLKGLKIPAELFAGPDGETVLMLSALL
jgi:Ca-activated chloride channel family protein